MSVQPLFFKRRATRHTAVAAFATALTTQAPLAWCALPNLSQIGAPSDGNYMTLVLWVVGIGIAVAALTTGGSAFLSVANGILSSFNEWRKGKAEAGELKAVVVGGAVVLALVILLLTIATSVIDSSGTVTG